MNVSTGTKLRRMELSSSIRNGGMFTMICDDGTTVVIPDPCVTVTDCNLESRNLHVRVTVEIFDPSQEKKT